MAPTRRTAVVLASLLFGAGGAACSKKAPPPPPPPEQPKLVAKPVAAVPELPPISCPGAEEFAPLGPKKGDKVERAFVTDCTVFSPGRYWLAVALSYDKKPPKPPKKVEAKNKKPADLQLGVRHTRLSMLSGGPGSRTMVFDIEPIPAPEIEALIEKSAEVAVKIRRTRQDNALVRLGVVGKTAAGKPDSKEIGLLLQLVAHKPPQMLWMGDGDAVSTDEQGCVTEQAVDFELLFRTRLERFTVSRTQAGPDGKPKAGCSVGPSMQDSVAFQPIPMKPGHLLVPEAAPAGAAKQPH